MVGHKRVSSASAQPGTAASAASAKVSSSVVRVSSPKEPGSPCVMAGFVRVEEDGERQRNRSLSTSSPCSPSKAEGKAAGKAKVFSRWLYGVLHGDTLKLYWRRTDYKRKTPPLDQLVLQMQPAAPNESVFGFDHECLYVRAKDSGRVVALRIHQRKEIVRWVTALYYQSISSGTAADAASSAASVNPASGDKHAKSHGANRHIKHSASKAASSLELDPLDEDKARPKRKKSVSFQDEPQVVVLPDEAYDPADLFYSEDDYEQFLQERPSHLSNLMKAIASKTAAKLRVSHKKNVR